MVRLRERVAPPNGKWQFSTFLNFEKSKTKSDLFMLFSKIGHQIDYFGKIKINSKFRPCRQILEIYRDWLLSYGREDLACLSWFYFQVTLKEQCQVHSLRTVYKCRKCSLNLSNTNLINSKLMIEPNLNI